MARDRYRRLPRAARDSLRHALRPFANGVFFARQRNAFSTAKCPPPCNYLHTEVHLSGRSFRRCPDLDHLERIRSRSSRARNKKKMGKKGRRCNGRGGRKRGGEEGTRIWPLQLEERGKAEVANPCKEPLYFLKEVLCAHLTPSLPPSSAVWPVRKIVGGSRRRVTEPSSSALIPLSSLSCNGHASSTLSARFDNDDDDDDVGRIPCRSDLPIFSFLRRKNPLYSLGI